MLPCFQDVGDGWWEARNYLGKVGLIPQAYVEVMFFLITKIYFNK